jgi:hypothetical protein
MVAVEMGKVDARDADENYDGAIQYQIPIQTPKILGGLRGSVQQRANDVAEGLANEQGRRVAFAFGVASGIRGGPRVDQGDWNER